MGQGRSGPQAHRHVRSRGTVGLHQLRAKPLAVQSDRQCHPKTALIRRIDPRGKYHPAVRLVVGLQIFHSGTECPGGRNCMKPAALLSWSSGKDCAWALHLLRQRAEVEVVGLVTTYNESFQRVAMHGVRMELVEAQAKAARLPLWAIPLPWPCSNEVYEERMRAVIERAHAEGIHAFAFGDLHLSDIREYRERQLAGSGLEPLFPVWGTPADTPKLARSMIAEGVRATLTCVDPKQLAPEFVGREFDYSLLADLPPSTDSCGERGEFHTFCHAGPMFDHPISVNVGERIERDGFWFADLLPGPESRQ